MNRIINDPDHVVEDAIQGYRLAHPNYYAATDNARVLKYPPAPIAGKVGIVTGGGSGHEPAFLGYVGKNMLDAVAIGEIFSSPTAGAFLDAFKAADSGAGVACLYGNYAGDNMNVKMAIKKATAAGIRVKTVVANDDVASAPASERDKRRGVAGEILMWKVGAAAAAKGYDLDGVIGAAQKAIDRCRSIGVGLSSCTIPRSANPIFISKTARWRSASAITANRALRYRRSSRRRRWPAPCSILCSTICRWNKARRWRC
ncbi:PTS-dependent dihydroxyacetone kinase, dihydroxyacetone-binding subunit dhaK [Serratia marcescens]|uniref:PTS-dependent dihydroxyacetone kinase, dihydroxyacetone-binding subunit dhaK n=1 Tax=Serratia marcescens TaxID=615 RepID=A0A379YWF9_SERMA|nr:PTS-dependent dihydroxyacetone kinase, dihydroxyacetone-binding subunit dhaK [Serratia marcescens]